MTIDESAEAALVGAAHKESAYLKRLCQSLLTFRRERRDGYQYQEQEQELSDHLENLNRCSSSRRQSSPGTPPSVISASARPAAEQYRRFEVA